MKIKRLNLRLAAAAVSLCVIALIAVVLLPLRPGSMAGPGDAHKAPAQTASSKEGLPNFDIRRDGSADALAQFRNAAGRDINMVQEVRDSIASGGDELRSRLPEVVVEYNDLLGNAEVISPSVWENDPEMLSRADGESRPNVLRGFIRENKGLFGISDAQADNLKQHANYTNPDGSLSFVHLEQMIGGIPVFAAEIKAGFDRSGRMIRVINGIAPGLSYETLSTEFGDPREAVKAAGRHIGQEIADDALRINTRSSNDKRSVFGGGDWATTAEKMYFPTEPSMAVPAWRVLIWEPVNAYYVIVDAASGALLWRKNITEDQSQTATYNVYRNSNAFVDVADSPAPFTPGPLAPDGSQSGVLTRENLTLAGNEGDLSFNNNGWVNDGANSTDGNSNQAGIDRDGVNGVDAAQVGSPTRVFSSTWNPPPGNPAPGDGPLTTQAQRGAVIQMFYVMNCYHDALYKLGFNEAARNFQHDNFGRGGSGGDRISSEGQDSSDTNNANFSTPADGGRGRMQMYLWTGPNPDRDGTADADIIIHEVTHGTSNRLHGNSSGLSTNMARGMGEGWSDFYAHAMLAEPTDPINGIYTIGGYSTLLATSNYTSNYYHGIRRFPKAVISFTGPNGKPHNPLTFRYVNNNCNTLIGSTTSNPPPNSAYPRGPFGSSTCDQVHNLGEVWSSALWEVRSLMVQRMGFTAGTERALQVVTNGMKLSPSGPTFLQARDAIISAAAAISAVDADDVREGFRRRGMGYNASIQNAGTGSNNTSVTESFDPWPTATPTPTPTPTPEPTPTPDPTPTPEPTPTPTPGFSLSVVARKQQGIRLADLSWTGASGTNVDYYRNSTKFSTANDGFHTDNTGLRGGGSITYRICETNSTTNCSNSVIATW